MVNRSEFLQEQKEKQARYEQEFARKEGAKITKPIATQAAFAAKVKSAEKVTFDEIYKGPAEEFKGEITTDQRNALKAFEAKNKKAESFKSNAEYLKKKTKSQETHREASLAEKRAEIEAAAKEHSEIMAKGKIAARDAASSANDRSSRLSAAKEMEMMKKAESESRSVREAEAKITKESALSKATKEAAAKPLKEAPQKENTPPSNESKVQAYLAATKAARGALDSGIKPSNSKEPTKKPLLSAAMQEKLAVFNKKGTQQRQ